MFADDTNAFRSGKNVTELSSTISTELQKLDVWFTMNKLSLNADKTKLMAFGNLKEFCKANVEIGRAVIERVNEINFRSLYR